MQTEVLKRQIKIDPGAVAGYMLSPQLGRRIKNLSINTEWFALLLISMFQLLRMIPSDLASTPLKNEEHRTIRGVMAYTANNVKFDLKHCDQIIIYGIVLLGLVLLIVQFALLAFVLSTNLAHAQFMGFFAPPAGADISNDIAFSMLDQVFGVPNLYGTKYDTAISGIPPFTQALQGTFYYYNFAMSTVAAFLVIYFIFVVIIETIQDGTPFGKRFASGYVPLRLIIALAFLVPTYHGFSTGQHLVLNVAKIGGNFATNTWLMFVTKVQVPIGNGGDNILAKQNAPDQSAFIEGLLLANLCAAYHKQEYHVNYSNMVDSSGTTLYTTEQPVAVTRNAAGVVTNITQNLHKISSGQPYPIEIFTIYDVRDNGDIPAVFAGLGFGAPAPIYYTDLPATASPITLDYQTYLAATENKDVRIRFGQVHPDFKGDIMADGSTAPVNGGVRPICGELLIPGAPNPSKNLAPSAATSATQHWRTTFLSALITAWLGDYMTGFSQRMLAINGIIPGVNGCDIAVPATNLWGEVMPWENCNQPPPSQYYEALFRGFQNFLDANFDVAYNLAAEESKAQLWLVGGNNTLNNDIFKYGWAGAGMWYNEISDLYGAYSNVFKAGSVRKYPQILAEVAQAKRTLQEDARDDDMFNPRIPNFGKNGDGKYDGSTGYVTLKNPNDLKYAIMMHQVIKGFINKESQENYARKDNTSGFVNMINIIFGLEGVFNLRENGDIHPFGMLIGAGKGLIDSSILAFTGTIFTTGISGYLSALGATSGAKIADAATTISAMAATVGLTAGIILFYVIPLTPFMYFFLAAGRWVKSIFEAMIAVPLWAMAHIRIDGTGLPGVAGNGYFLVFEIFLRPVLTLFGLLASIATYGALMVVFNDIFDLVVDNLANNNIADAAANPDYVDTFRGTVDMFFYTVLYAIIAYMMAMASFKLIDLIPDSILRWMGAGVKSFGDESGNIAEGLNRTISIQGTMASESVSDIARGAGGVAGQGAGSVTQALQKNRLF